MKHIPDFLIFYAPTVNSYKRLKETNLNNNWNKVGYQRSDCGVNIIEEKEISKLHFTIAGSDVNQYFALFSLINSVKIILIIIKLDKIGIGEQGCTERVFTTN
jgi:glutamine synthetase